MALQTGGSGSGRAPSLGSDPGGGASGPALGSLERVLSAGFNDLAANPETGGEVRLPNAAEQEELEEQDDQRDVDDDSADDSDSDAGGESDSETPSDKSADSQAKKPAEGEPPSPAAGSSATAADAAASQVLTTDELSQDYSRDELDAIRKFLPGNSLEGVTRQAFREAKAKAAADYWRIQRANAEALSPKADKSKDDKQDTPAADSKPQERAEVSHLTARLQEINADGLKAKAQIEGWTEEIATRQQKVAQLEEAARQGEPVDPADLNKAYRELSQAQKTKAGWQRQFEQLRSSHDDTLNRKKEVELILETRDTVTAERKKHEDARAQAASAEFYKSWETTLTALAAEKGIKDPNSKRFKALVKAVRGATFLEAQREAITPERLKPFLKGEVDAFVEAYEETAKEVKETYAEQKAADAPKVPAQAKRAKAKPAAKSSILPSANASLRELENKITKSDAWKNL